jgi:DNA-binding MarR family transcriptional regulator/ribosomal protein S18 acetylase RimI-like enzyme
VHVDEVDDVETVRHFNRTVTARIGALEDEYLARGRPLGASRVLWELGQVHDTRTLRARLGLDSGYLSRLLRRLEGEGLVTTQPDPADQRVRRVQLTAAGRRERAVLDARSDDVARSLLDPLDDGRRRRLVEAMGTVDRLLTAGAVHVAVADPTTVEARRCLDAYYAELACRFDGGFDPGTTTQVDLAGLVEPHGLLLLARLHGDAVGCGALVLHGTRPAEIKRVWIDERVRGLGVGRRLLTALEAEASVRGVRTVRLDTNRALVEAIAMYRAAGYREIERFNDEPYAHHWFEKRLPRRRPR